MVIALSALVAASTNESPTMLAVDGAASIGCRCGLRCRPCLASAGPPFRVIAMAAIRGCRRPDLAAEDGDPDENYDAMMAEYATLIAFAGMTGERVK